MKLVIALVAALLLPSVALGYAVAPAVPMDVLVKEADVILKGAVLASAKVKDDSFKAYPHWAVFSTRMKVVSVLKGELAEREVEFRHYDADPDSKMGFMFSPQWYHFEAGRSYVVFAKGTTTPGMLRAIWDSHRGKEDQGLVMAADDAPIAAGTEVKRAVWGELTKLAGSEKGTDVQYAIRQLHSMSSGDRHDGTNDFAREQVMGVLAPLIGNPDVGVAAAAVEVVGSHSPYLREDYIGWLATVGKGNLLSRGHSKYPEKWENVDARKALDRLMEVAEKGKDTGLRARAIRAMGLTREQRVREGLRKWSVDPAAEVRAAAAVVWADFPSAETCGKLTELAADKDSSVRRSVAAAVGFLQEPALVGLLEKFLKDPDERLRAAAGMSAVSFDPSESGELLKAFRKDPDFGATFVNALALADAKPYLDELARIVSGNEEPKLHFVSQMPVYTSWQILKAEMETRTAAELAGGGLDKYLDALELPPNTGSGPFQEVYQFYVERGLKERAARFREAAKRRITTYDIDYYFKRVDESVR
jgi:hypothetical protein